MVKISDFLDDWKLEKLQKIDHMKIATDAAAMATTPQNESKLKNMNLNNKFNTYEQFRLRQITATIVENIGFSTASNSAICILSSFLRTYFEQLCRDATEFAKHADRDIVALEDVSRVFEHNSRVNLAELQDYLHQVENFNLREQIPFIPVPVSSLPQLDFASQPEKPENAIEKTANTGEVMEESQEISEKEKQIETNNLEQRANMRITQRIFPKFTDCFAQELGFSVRKIVPPTVEINIDCQFTKYLSHSEASFNIAKEEHVIGPTLSVLAIPENERHKEKKRKKKEKREQDEKEGRERKKHHREKEKRRNSKESTSEEKKEKGGDKDQPLKVPKIKIRIGPSPNSAPSHCQETPELIALPSTSTVTSHITNIEERIGKEQEQVSRPSPPKFDNSLTEEHISPKATPSLLVPPLKIVKSPPEKGIERNAAPLPQQQKDEIKIAETVPIPIITKLQEKADLEESSVKHINSKLPTPLSVQPTITIQAETHQSTPNLKMTSNGKKRNRKSEKPTRVDPAISFISSLEPAPSGNTPTQSKALESVIPTSTVQPKKLSEPPMTVIEPKASKNGRSSAQAKIVPVEHKKSATKKEKIKSSKVDVAPPKPSTASTNLTAVPGEEEQEEDIWICPICSVAYVENGPDMVACDGCDSWFHWSCVGILIPPPENAPWFCSECRKKRKKQQGGIESGGPPSRKSSAGAPPTKKRRPSK